VSTTTPLGLERKLNYDLPRQGLPALLYGVRFRRCRNDTHNLRVGIMNRLEAEKVSAAIRVYVEARLAAFIADNPKADATARLAFERLEDALVAASRHG